ncbi:SpoIIE family protein phosphatase [Selenomonas sp. KH1T6]|uniref:SpoIIE family protein phosphatase n=1 Tax=Selenomonas sp. KH1T6 TaxID=3158784 RepID=UPI0008A769EB|nr:sigma-B regulation protein RsbU (phosphoserine phosphatase) [Selenomonas ruminantium]
MKYKLSIRRRFLLLLFLAGIFSFLVLGAASLWSMYDIQQETLENGERMGAVAGGATEKLTVRLAQLELMAVAQEKANKVDRELRTIKEDSEYIAFMMEKLMARPEGHKVKQVKNPMVDHIGSGEVYLYYPPGLRSQEAVAKLSDEVGVASGIADTLENMAKTYPGCEGSILVASESGYMYCTDLLLPGQEHVVFTDEFFDTYDPKERPWYKTAVEKGAPTITDIYMGSDGFPVIDHVAPFYVGQKLGGVASIGLSLRAMYQVIMDRSHGGTGINFVLNEKGVVAVSSEESGLLAASPDGKDLRQAAEPSLVGKISSMVEGRSGVLPVSIEGEKYYLAYAPIPSVSWSFGTLVKEEEVTAPALTAREKMTLQLEGFNLLMREFFRDNVREMALLLVVILAMLFVGSKAAADWFVRPILALTEGVGEIAKGDLDKKLAIHTGDEIEELSDTVNYMTSELKEYMANLSRVTADKQRIATELSMAQNIQEGMLPRIFPSTSDNSGFELFATMNAAKEVGGDFYDFYTLDREHLAVTMADVSGKGIGAALFMVIAKTILKNNALAAGRIDENIDWAQVMEMANKQLCENNKKRMFVTVFFGVLDLRTGVFSYVSGGHNPPLIGHREAGGMAWEYVQIEKVGLVLGARKKATFSMERLTLKPGDMLYLYTDGVTEAMDQEGNLYGEERLQRMLNQVGASAASVEEILAAIRADIDVHANGAEQSDDITMLGLRFLGDDTVREEEAE